MVSNEKIGVRVRLVEEIRLYGRVFAKGLVGTATTPRPERFGRGVGRTVFVDFEDGTLAGVQWSNLQEVTD